MKKQVKRGKNEEKGTISQEGATVRQLKSKIRN